MACITPEVENFALRVNTDLCGNCVFCVSVCPFEAIIQVPETKKIKIDPNKCRLCGICYATCPSRLIEVQYYNTELLTEYIHKRINDQKAQEVVIACRGTALKPSNWSEKLQRNNKDNRVIFFSLPCLGRIHLNFLLNMAGAGVQKISLVSCQQEFCRYKKGSEVTASRYASAQALFEDMGYSGDMLELHTMAPKVTIDENKCISCGTCGFVCPYEAIKIVDKAKLDKEKCKGCGLCVPTCPNLAISIEGSECERITEEIESFADKKLKPKILVLGCQWSEYKCGDDNTTLPEGVKFIGMPCSGRIDLLHILKAFTAGIDGVMVSMCLDDICNLETGNKRALSRIRKLLKSLEKLGIHNRLKLSEVHPKYLGMFEKELKEFIETISR